MSDIEQISARIQELMVRHSQRLHHDTDGNLEDSAILLEILRYTHAMLESQDLSCHFLNFVER